MLLPAISHLRESDKSKNLIRAHRRLQGEGVQLAAHPPFNAG
jgi:hypothetical protein